MIQSIRHKALRRFYETANPRGLDSRMLPRLEEILSLLEAAKYTEELQLPGYRLHRLTGDLSGFWSIRVTGNWRIIFRFEQGKAYDVDLVDYH